MPRPTALLVARRKPMRILRQNLSLPVSVFKTHIHAQHLKKKSPQIHAQHLKKKFHQGTVAPFEHPHSIRYFDNQTTSSFLCGSNLYVN